MFMSVKLDRLAVGIDLEARNGLSNQCSIGANDEFVSGQRPLHILLPGFAEDPFNERTMDGH